MVFCTDVTAPENFDLFLGPSSRPYRARTIWQRANDVGVRFLDARANVPEVLPDVEQVQA